MRASVIGDDQLSLICQHRITLSPALQSKGGCETNGAEAARKKFFRELLRLLKNREFRIFDA